MGKEKRAGEWTVFLHGAAIAWGVYMAGICLMAFLMVKGFLPEKLGGGFLAGIGFLSSVVGGITSARKSAFATMPSAMLSTVFFLLVLVLTGLAVWPETFWGEASAVIAAFVMMGGIAAGILAAGKRTRRKQGRSRIGAK